MPERKSPKKSKVRKPPVRRISTGERLTGIEKCEHEIIKLEQANEALKNTIKGNNAKLIDLSRRRRSLSTEELPLFDQPGKDKKDKKRKATPTKKRRK